MVYKLKGGVLIIGSLFWQDDLSPTNKDGLRKKWRNKRLDMSKSINVSVPIRYGRFSGSVKMSNQTYTMIFDRHLSEESFGTGKVVPFKHSPVDWNELKSEVEALSRAEGDGSHFIKGSSDKKEAWCVCAICFNPKVNKQVKSEILSDWKDAFSECPKGYAYFSNAPERFSLNGDGELDIPWPSEADSFDYLIATSTQPRNRNAIKDLPIQEIARYATNRDYLKPNISHGITTYQDKEILKALSLDKV